MATNTFSFFLILPVCTSLTLTPYGIPWSRFLRISPELFLFGVRVISHGFKRIGFNLAHTVGCHTYNVRHSITSSRRNQKTLFPKWLLFKFVEEVGRIWLERTAPFGFVDQIMTLSMVRVVTKNMLCSFPFSFNKELFLIVVSAHVCGSSWFTQVVLFHCDNEWCTF